MSDNWSAFTTLSSQWDYIQWTVNLSATDAAYLNGQHADVTGPFIGRPNASMSVRGARQNNTDTTGWFFQINHWLGFFNTFGDEPADSGNWAEAGRFWQGADSHGGFDTQIIYSTLPNGYWSGISGGFEFYAPLPGAVPWIEGDNTVRVINQTSNPIDIDNVHLGTIHQIATVSTELAAEAKPSGYDTWVNGSTIGSGAKVWYLKAPDGTTGSLAVPTLTILSACVDAAGRAQITIQVEVGGDPAPDGPVGAVGQFFDQLIDPAFTRTTLSGGFASFSVGTNLGSLIPIIWYGGADGVAPIDAFCTPPPCGESQWGVGTIG